MENPVFVYCRVSDCIYNQEGRCQATGIEIRNMVCETYVKEELNPLDDPDKERDIKED